MPETNNAKPAGDQQAQLFDSIFKTLFDVKASGEARVAALKSLHKPMYEAAINAALHAGYVANREKMAVGACGLLFSYAKQELEQDVVNDAVKLLKDELTTRYRIAKACVA